MDNNMLRFVEIRNTYARPKIGELSINEKALAEYEKFCLDLIKENKKQKEMIDKAIDFIKNGDLLYFANKNSVVYKDNIEVRVVSYRLSNLLEILEDKEV